ncbi:hypothetical protein [Xylella fastidiosa]|uniref:hypothetical protein n=1 Tax=Xylella fastidiosa TaxID=2371 RepID=UPI00111F4379|nr:hypothetical protein [Xylella fastidiosa]
MLGTDETVAAEAAQGVALDLHLRVYGLTTQSWGDLSIPGYTYLSMGPNSSQHLPLPDYSDSLP